MIGAMREWLVSVVCAAILVSAAEQLTPAGNLRKIVSMTGGLVILSILLHPLGDLETGSLQAGCRDYALEVERRREELERESFRELEALIEARTAAYISDKAKELGVVCRRADVECRTDDSGIPQPWSVTVYGTETQEMKSWIRKELDIPAERQVFREADG